jgi:hypothetical protein
MKHRVRAGDVILPYRISHARNDYGLVKCPVSEIYWICVLTREHGWRAARIADERDFRYMTKDEKK